MRLSSLWIFLLIFFLLICGASYSYASGNADYTGKANMRSSTRHDKREFTKVVIFEDDFEGDTSLPDWTGMISSTHSGYITTDPITAGNNVLSMSAKASNGDIVTSSSFTSADDTYVLTFRYLGNTSYVGANDNLGGFAGYTTDPGDSGKLVWLAGTDAAYTDAAGVTITHLIDDDKWHDVTVSFTSSEPVYLVFQDNAGVAGDVYFDAVKLEVMSDSSTAVVSCANDINCGVLFYLPMEGNAYDESGNGNIAIVSGASLTNDRDGNSENAYAFDGNDDRIVVQNSESLNLENSFTLSVWFRLENIGREVRHIIRKGDQAATGSVVFDLYIIDYDEIGLSILNNAYMTTSANLQPDVWYHVVAVFNGDTDVMMMYLDGVQVYSDSITGDLIDEAYPIVIGNGPVADVGFEGDMDDVILYGRALSSSEITQLLNGNPNKAVKTDNIIDGLIAYYPFHGDVKDFSGNGNDGTLYNATLTEDRNGNSGNAFHFDGNSQYISVPMDIGATAMPKLTMTAWARFSGDDSYRRTVISNDSGSYDRTIGLEYTSSRGWYAFGGTTSQVGFQPVVKDDWIFLAAVYDQENETVVFYADDQKFEATGVIGSSHDYFRIGSNPSYGEYFIGDIDEVRLYNRALSDSEIRAIRLYKENPQTLCTGILSCGIAAHFPLNSATEIIEETTLSANISGTLTFENGPVGNAAVFDGASTVEVDDAEALNPAYDSFTLSAWFKTTEADWLRFISKGHYSYSTGYLLGMNYFTSGSVSGGVNTFLLSTEETGYNDGKWHHAAMVIDKATNTASLFVDGERKAISQDSETGCGVLSSDGMNFDISGCTSNTATASGEPLTLNGYAGGQERFAGGLDDVRIYNRPLALVEITKLFNDGLQCSGLTCGLLAYYPFNSGADDESGNMINGELYGAYTETNESGNGAVIFNGVSDYMEAPDSDKFDFGDKDFSISLWVKFNSVPASTAPLIGQTDGGGTLSKWVLVYNYTTSSFYTPGKLTLHINGSYLKDITADWTPETGAWHFLTIIRKNDVITMTADGNEIHSETFTETMPDPSSPLYAGGYFEGSGSQIAYGFNGAMDEIRIYGRALEPIETEKLLNDTKPAPDNDISGGDLTLDLLASYPLNGNTNDISGNGMVAQNYGATAAKDRFATNGGAMYFNGSSYIQTPIDGNTLPMSYSVWFRADDVSGERSIVDSDVYNEYGHSLIIGYQNGGGTLNVQYHDGYIDTGFAVTAGQWYHAVLSYDSDITLYINGSLILDTPYSKGNVNGSEIRFGRHNSSDPQWFIGAMDDIRIYNRVLTTTDVMKLYTRGLSAYYPMDGDANDYSGNKNNGVVHSANLVQDRNGALQSAYSFNGSDSYIELGESAVFDFTGKDKMTLSAWIKTGADGNIFERYGSLASYRLFVYGDLLGFTYYAGGSYQTLNLYGTKTVTDNQWHHVSGVLDGSYLSLYVDGIRVGRDVQVGPIADPGGVSSVYIGMETPGASWFSGAIDDVRLYERALSENEIRNLAGLPSIAGASGDNGIMPDIKVNGSDGGINGVLTLTRFQDLSITASLANDENESMDAEFYIFGEFFDFQTGLWLKIPGIDLEFTEDTLEFFPLELWNLSELPTGYYNFRFILDTNLNGVMDEGQKEDIVHVEVGVTLNSLREY